MLEDLIKLAIQKINEVGEMQYEIIEGTGNLKPSINWIRENGTKEEVLFDMSLIQSISVTRNTLILYEDEEMTIISPINWTYHGCEP